MKRNQQKRWGNGVQREVGEWAEELNVQVRKAWLRGGHRVRT